MMGGGDRGDSAWVGLEADQHDRDPDRRSGRDL